MRREGGKICWRSVSRGGKRGENPEKRLPAAGRGDHISIASRGGRDSATVHVSHECACWSSLEKVVWRHMQSSLSSKGHKKRSCRRGERPLLCEPSTPAGSWGRKRCPRAGREPFLFYRCLLLQQQSASHLIGRFRAHQIVHHGHAESIDHARLFV